MSRVIKFRAWTKDWDGVYRMSFSDKYEEDEIPTSAHQLMSYFFRNLNPNAELMQFTGLHDKNGIEIYEGDVVKKGDQSFSNGPDTDDTFYRGGTAHVVAVPFGFYMSEIDCGEWCFNGPEGREWDNAEIEVIGNIYQNPELLTPPNHEKQ